MNSSPQEARAALSVVTSFSYNILLSISLLTATGTQELETSPLGSLMLEAKIISPHAVRFEL